MVSPPWAVTKAGSKVSWASPRRTARVRGPASWLSGTAEKRPRLAYTFVTDYPGLVRLNDIAKHTRNQIQPVKFDENGRLVPATPAAPPGGTGP